MKSELTINKDELSEANDLENTMMCARWLVSQFENLDLLVPAKIFQRALEDSEIWLQNMVNYGELSENHLQPIKIEEAKTIHNILIKYASVDCPNMRQGILDEMLRITKKKQH